jgi:hypothetical protein
MKKSFVVIACMAALVVLVTVQSVAAQGKIEGVWKLTEITISSPKPQTIAVAQPNLSIITKKHFSYIGIESDKPRPDLPQKDATDAQKVATWAPFEAFAGTYEVKGTTLTGRGIVAKNPRDMAPGNFATYEYKIEGNTLIMTMKATQSGPATAPYTLKYVRVE